ncbi:TPA: NmrA/HSCARG family protein [Pseudomonas aeruginosa]|nr:NmrA/HSCARG family protein [Pseudomonas aeruginosa]MBH9226377.1 NmrA/HSCARG family protein [Pseudomonas aeruginosa]
MSASKKVIAVVGASGQQGGSVVKALLADGSFTVRAITRSPEKHLGLADEVVAADLNDIASLRGAFSGAHGVFVVTNFWEQGTDEVQQARSAIEAAKSEGVKHFIWSTLPNVEEISNGKYVVPHFTGKAKVDGLVKDAGFDNYHFVVPPFFYQNLLELLAPQKQADGSMGWTFPLNPSKKAVHMGDITELGKIVAGVFSSPNAAPNGQYLPLVGDFLSFNEIINVLNMQGHKFTFTKVPADVYATFYPGAEEIAQMFGYFEEYSYLGGVYADYAVVSNRISKMMPVSFAEWAQSNFK